MLNKQSILITGCTHGGIGYATAKRLRMLGHTVFASAKRKEVVEYLIDEGFDTYLLDVRDYNQVQEVLDDIVRKTGGSLDVLFNNAGYSQAGALEDVPTQYLKENFETNVFGLHNLTRQVLKIMRKQGYGKVIQHGSVLGLAPLKYRGSYNASKYAVEGIADSMRLELQGTSIYMSTLNTGPITSRIRENSIKHTARNIVIEGSAHKEHYNKMKTSGQKAIPFHEDAESVVRVVEKILNTAKPSPRYHITKFTWILITLKRLLPTILLDKFLGRF